MVGVEEMTGRNLLDQLIGEVSNTL
jgi:hypothetical protein